MQATIGGAMHRLADGSIRLNVAATSGHGGSLHGERVTGKYLTPVIPSHHASVTPQPGMTSRDHGDYDATQHYVIAIPKMTSFSALPTGSGRV